jgi:hypothetical protein
MAHYLIRQMFPRLEPRPSINLIRLKRRQLQLTLACLILLWLLNLAIAIDLAFYLRCGFQTLILRDRPLRHLLLGPIHKHPSSVTVLPALLNQLR